MKTFLVRVERTVVQSYEIEVVAENATAARAEAVDIASDRGDSANPHTTTGAWRAKPGGTRDVDARVEAVRDRLDVERAKAREYVKSEAEDAGLDPDTVAACVDSAMSAWGDPVSAPDQESWEDLVASVIQGHAAP